MKLVLVLLLFQYDLLIFTEQLQFSPQKKLIYNFLGDIFLWCGISEG